MSRKVGRPNKEINQSEFEKLCNIMCTEEEIAGFFGVDISTLWRWCKRTYGEDFANISKKYQGVGKISLRRNLFKLSQTNASTAIFLAKNYLGMTDEPQVKNEYENITTLAELINEQD